MALGLGHASGWGSVTSPCFSNRMLPRREAQATRSGRTIPELRLAAWRFAVNALWEFLQTPLYADRDGGLLYLLRTRLRCGVGDVLILLGSFSAVSLLWRDRHWTANRRFAPRALFVILASATRSSASR